MGKQREKLFFYLRNPHEAGYAKENQTGYAVFLYHFLYIGNVERPT